MAFATNDDLVKIHPTVLDHGVVDWTDELAMAEDDITTMIKTKWFLVEFGSYRTRGMVAQPVYNPDLLVGSQWTKAVCYRALSAYIMPKLSTFRPEGDTFSVASDFYKARFDDEMDMQLNAGVQYDVNDDGEIKEAEKFSTFSNRLYR